MFFRPRGCLCRKARIIDAMSNYTFEVTPTSAKKVVDFSKYKGRKSNVTFLPGTDIRETTDTVARLYKEGVIPVPHIAARSFKNLNQVEDYLRILQASKVDEVLVIGGGVTTPVGSINESLDILRSGLLEQYGIRRVGMAAHPEGSPDISPETLHAAMHQKLHWAKNSSFECYWATQLCFATEAFTSLREFNDIPLRIGLSGPAKLSTLIKFSLGAGVGNSIRFLTKYSGNALKLLTKQAPDDIIDTLAASMKENNIDGFHFYTFGGVANTVDWAEKVVAGSFALKDPVGFDVE
eukprot:GEMP01059038.1.p1 GENE.GEMP01059038.1~~GEMP01059038.1.p1  ORF type:complete len:294 (+),score=61.94 GEMP01059038.1:169-1050(+)